MWKNVQNILHPKLNFNAWFAPKDKNIPRFCSQRGAASSTRAQESILEFWIESMPESFLGRSGCLGRLVPMSIILLTKREKLKLPGNIETNKCWLEVLILNHFFPSFGICEMLLGLRPRPISTWVPGMFTPVMASVIGCFTWRRG